MPNTPRPSAACVSFPHQVCPPNTSPSTARAPSPTRAVSPPLPFPSLLLDGPQPAVTIQRLKSPYENYKPTGPAPASAQPAFCAGCASQKPSIRCAFSALKPPGARDQDADFFAPFLWGRLRPARRLWRSCRKRPGFRVISTIDLPVPPSVNRLGRTGRAAVSIDPSATRPGPRWPAGSSPCSGRSASPARSSSRSRRPGFVGCAPGHRLFCDVRLRFLTTVRT